MEPSLRLLAIEDVRPVTEKLDTLASVFVGSVFTYRDLLQPRPNVTGVPSIGEG